MPRPPGWSRRLLPAYALQRVADLGGGERRKLDIWHRDHSFPTPLQLHGSGCDLDLEPTVTGPDLEGLSGLQPESLPQGFGHDDSSGSINDSFHAMDSAMKMVLAQSPRAELLRPVHPSQRVIVRRGFVITRKELRS